MNEQKVMPYINNMEDTLDKLYAIKAGYNTVTETIEMTQEQLVELMNTPSFVSYTSTTEGLSPLFGIPLVIKD